MPLDGKPLAQVTEADIQELIDNGVVEGKEIDFKRDLQIGTESERKEFLADVSSFANASGGHLVFGVEEVDGRATSIAPLAVTSWDASRLKMEAVIRDGVAPRIAVEFTAVPVSGGHVIVLRIAKNWTGPHMVTFQRNGKFHSRHSAGKYQLDVGELRSAFALGTEIAEAVRIFRQGRIGDIIAGETPVPMRDGAKLILHVFPYSAARTPTPVDLESAHQRRELMMPMEGGYSTGFNLDGVISSTPHASGTYTSYNQLFRDGRVEAVTSTMLAPDTPAGSTIPSVLLAAETIKCLGRVLQLLRHLDVQAPAALMLTLTGVKGYTLAMNRQTFRSRSQLINRNVLSLPSEIIQVYDSDPIGLMRPILDALWNVGGFSRCDLYDEGGRATQELSIYLA
jgi:hypothetical protein